MHNYIGRLYILHMHTTKRAQQYLYNNLAWDTTKSQKTWLVNGLHGYIFMLLLLICWQKQGYIVKMKLVNEFEPVCFPVYSDFFSYVHLASVFALYAVTEHKKQTCWN